MPKRFLAYFGHLNIDISIRVREIPVNGSISASSVEERFGGTAGNFAIIANRLGVPFDVYGAVSPRTHAEYNRFLEREGIDTGHLAIVENSYGPVCYIASDGGKQVAYMFQGPMEKWDLADTFDFSSEYEWAHFSTGPPVEYLRVAEKVKSDMVVFDPGQEISYMYDSDLATRFLRASSMFIGNSFEYETLQKLTGKDPDQINAGLKNIIITQGSSGVMAKINGDIKRFRSQRVEKVFDTIGAGDAFRAGLYFGLYKKHTMDDSIICGILTASEAIMKPIAEFSLKAEELEAMLEKHRDTMAVE